MRTFSYWINGRKMKENQMWHVVHSIDNFDPHLLYPGVQFHAGATGDCLRYWKSENHRYNGQGYDCNKEMFFICDFV